MSHTLQNEDLTYVYRPAPNSEGGTSFYIRDSMLETLAYNAKVSREHSWKIFPIRCVHYASPVNTCIVQKGIWESRVSGAMK